MFFASSRATEYPDSPQFRDGAFRNAAPPAPREGSALGLWWKFMTARNPNTRPSAPVLVQPLTPAMLADAPDGRLYRLGHSTVLLRLDGGWWLTDPVFSERASPVQWAGPKRFEAPPIALDALPPLRGVILSHDHYDHLDKATIRALAQRADHFIAPLGVGDLLQRWGVPAARIVQLDWWQSWRDGNVELTATPAQHFSGRSPFGSNPTLWASWAIRAPGASVFFSGDGGYAPHFAEIGQRLGPFDLTLVECGAYDAQWADIHMLPEQTVQAHLDLRGRQLLPIHNGTFDLAFHDWYEPMERVLAAARAHDVAVSTPRFGAPVDIARPPQVDAWWRAPSDARQTGRLVTAGENAR